MCTFLKFHGPIALTILQNKFKVGEEIEVLVVSLDKENRRMSLSIKQLKKIHGNKLKNNSKLANILKAPLATLPTLVSSFNCYQALMALCIFLIFHGQNILIIQADIYKKGDNVEAVILGIDEDNKKISLGIKQLQQDPWEKIEKEYPVNTSLKVLFLRSPILVHLLNSQAALKDWCTFPNLQMITLIKLKMC